MGLYLGGFKVQKVQCSKSVLNDGEGSCFPVDPSRLRTGEAPALNFNDFFSGSFGAHSSAYMWRYSLSLSLSLSLDA
jgi:hypothetical protein